MNTEIATKASFEKIRYAQLWEDGAILCDALGNRSGGTLISIGSAGDNALSMLTLDPIRVIAADLSGAQIAAIKLRIAAWEILEHSELIELIGSISSNRRGELLDKALKNTDSETAIFWDNLRPEVIKYGAGGVGKFENYFRIFRKYCLPLVHSDKTIAEIFIPRSKEERIEFYNKKWNNWRWKTLLKIFFSRQTMGLLGRDPAFFDHVSTSVPEHVAMRIEHCFIENDPVNNPYLYWIMYGRHLNTLPHAYRPENHKLIRERLDRFEVFHGTIEDAANQDSVKSSGVDGWNLSDIFEYMSEENYTNCYETLMNSSNSGARFVYWNMMAPRSMPQKFSDRINIRTDIAAPLAARDNAFFYSQFHVEDMK